TCLATGAHLKTTIAVSVAGHIVLSQHIGDLDSVETRARHRQTIIDLEHLYRVTPEVLAQDMHPDIGGVGNASLRNASEQSIRETQHHAAHVASCMIEHGRDPREVTALGFSWDGVGF